MTDGLPDRLTQLRARWEADPASRIFLQLAEEYRHLGRVSEALTVLDAGLREHPGYLSALIAKGRCLLELGQPEAARDVLERVVKQDATQIVANKLLVRAYLETGQHDRARERLDLYALLHDADPEVDDLRRRIQGEGGAGAGQAADAASGSVAEAASGQVPAPVSGHLADPAGEPDPFSLLAPAPPPGLAPRREDDVFELDLPSLPARRAALEDIDVFELPPPVLAPPPAPAATAAATAGVPAAAAAVAAPEAPDAFDLLEFDLEPDLEPGADDPFPELVSREARRRYLSALASEGIFELGELGRLDRHEPGGAAPARSPAPAAQTLPAVQPAEDLFELELAPEPAAPAAPADPAFDETVEPAAAFELPPVELAPEPDQAPPPLPPSLPEIAPWEPLAEPAFSEPVAAWPEPGPEPGSEPEPEPPPASFQVLAPPAAPESSPGRPGEAALAGPEPATVTLGQLYLRQGHRGEAERLFREVLRREPGNAAARAALDEIARTAAPPAGQEAPAAQAAMPAAGVALTADDLLAGAPRGDLRARKVHLLQGYLARLRRGGSHRVP